MDYQDPVHALLGDVLVPLDGITGTNGSVFFCVFY